MATMGRISPPARWAVILAGMTAIGGPSESGQRAAGSGQVVGDPSLPAARCPLRPHLEQPPVRRMNVVAEAGEDDALDRRRALDGGARLADGDLRGRVDRIAVYAAADRRKGDRFHAVLDGQT